LTATWKTVAATVLCIATLCSATAKNYTTGKVYQFSVRHCGEYAQDRKLPDGVGMNAIDTWYVAGWLTAYNDMVPGGNIEGDGAVNSTLLWLDRYCLDHPSSSVPDGLAEFGAIFAPQMLKK